MSKFIGTVRASSIVAAFSIALATPALGDVVVNNVLSPGSVTVVGPGSGYGGRDYYDGPRGYEPGYYERYDRPRFERRGYERPGYYRSRFGGEYGPRGRYCWVSTDKDRGYGYWGWC